MTTYPNTGRERPVIDGHRNLRASTEKFAHHAPGGQTAQFGAITAAVSGSPLPVFNRILVFESPASDDLEAAVAWVAKHEVPFLVTVTEPLIDAVADLADDLDLTKTNQSVLGMVLSPLDDIPPNGTTATIDVVTDTDELDDFITVSSEVFEVPLGPVRQVHPDSLLADEDFDMFIGRVNGRPVACGQLVQTDDVAGIYSIGVVEDHRRRGIGEAMTWEVLRTGRGSGCQVGVLQSTEMAYPLYDQMGFETVTHYYHFEQAG